MKNVIGRFEMQQRLNRLFTSDLTFQVLFARLQPAPIRLPRRDEEARIVRRRDLGRHRHLPLLLLPALLAGALAMAGSAFASIGVPVSVGQANSITTGTTLTVTVPAAGVAAGNTVLVSFAMDPVSGTVSVADSRGNTYTDDADIMNGTSGSGTGVRTVVLSAPVTTALVSGDTITITFPSVGSKAVSIYSVNDLISASRVDKTATGTGNSSSPSSGATAATTHANELLIGAVGSESKISSTTMTAGSSFTLLNNASADTGNSSTSITVFPEYRIVSATGAQTAGGSLLSSDRWAAGIATYVSADQVITFPSPGNQTYGVAPVTLTATSDSGLAVSYAVASGPATVAGSSLTLTGAGSVSIVASQSGNAIWNAANNVTNTITVSAKTLTVSGVTANGKVYDGTTVATLNLGSASLTGVLAGDVGNVSVNPTGYTANFSSAAVGSRAVTVSGLGLTGSAAANYSLTQPTLANATISAAPLTITANNQSKNYGATMATGTGQTSFTPSGLQNGETVGTVSLASTGAAATAAIGSYNITPSLATGGTFTAGNYTITYNTGTLTVNPAPLSITASAQSKTYGSTLSLGTSAFMSSGLQNSQTIGSVTLTANAGTAATDPVGAYTITPSAATGGTFTAANYSITYNNGTLTVNTKALTVSGITASNKVYDGTTVATLNLGPASLTGVVAGDVGNVSVNPTGYTANFSTATVGTRAVTLSGLGLTGSAATNYSLTQPSLANATISAAPLTITANNQSKNYGATMATGTGQTSFTPTGLQNGETVATVSLASTGAAATAAVGSYNITPSLATGGTFTAGNYTITYATGTLTVNLAPLSITANAQSKTYGTNLTLGTSAFTSSGLQNSQTIGSVTLTANAGTAATDPAGAYTITPSAATGGTFTAANYTITYNTGTLTVNARTLTITASAETKTYGNTLTLGPGMTSFISTGLQNSETVGSVTLAANGGTAATDPAGFYTLTPSAATGGTFNAANYNIAYVNGTLTVVPGAIDHYGVTVATPHSAGLAFVVTATAQDSGNNPQTNDSGNVVTMTATGNAQYDHNGDGIYGDNTATLTNGSAGILTRDLTEETVTFAATDSNGITGNITVAINAPAGAYRSIASGAWGNAANWQTNNGSGWVTATAAPTSANSTEINIVSPNNVAVMASVSVDHVVVQAGAQVTVSNGITVTIANGAGTDFDVFGTLQNAGTVTTTGNLMFQSGGTYQHNFTTSDGTVPTATWVPGSTCAVTGYTTFSGNPAGGWGQSFANFVWNCPNQTAASDFSFGGELLTVNGNFTIVSTGAGDMRLGNTGAGNLAVGGDFSQTGGSFRVSNGGDRNVTVAGNFSLSGGTLDLDDSSDTVNFNVGGDFSQTGGTITQTSSGTVAMVFDKAGTQNYTAAGTISGAVNLTVNSGSTLNLGANVTEGSGTFAVNGILNCGANIISGTGKFTLASGAGLQAGSASGITSSGATGNIQVTGTRTFNTAANYTYNGAAAQATGNGLPATVNSLTVANAAGVTLTGGTTVNGTLGLSSGVLATGANTLIVPAAGVISGASSAGYVNGNLQHAFSTGNAQSYTFPIGDAANYLPLSLSAMNVTHAGNITVKTVGVDHPNIATALIDANVDVGRYWTITNGSSLAATYSATFNYSANDVANGATPAQFIIQDYNGGAWASAIVSGTPTTTAASISGQTVFGDFAIGDPKSSQTITFPAIGNQTYGAAPITLTATASSGLPVSYAVAGPATVSSGILTITGAANVTVTASQAGNADWTAATNVSQTITVAKLPVSGGITVNNKGYDGTTSATIATRSVSQVVGSDNVALSGGTATFSSKNVGANLTVVATGLSLINSSATNYTLITTSATNTASITARALTVTGATTSKGYDGTASSATLPTISSGTLATGDTSGFNETYINKNVGTTKTVIPAGTVNDGNGGNNYSVTFANANVGTITARAITVKAVTDSRTYDGTTASAVTPTISVGTLASGDTAGFSQAFNNRNVGVSKTLTPSGAVNDGNSGANYSVTYSTVTTGSITTRPITVSAVSDSKVYDGTTASAGVPVISTGSLGTGDTANFSQTFNSRNAAASVTLTPAGLVSDGNGGANYAVTLAPVNTGTISVRPITVTAATASKTYDGTMNSTVTPTVSGGLGSGDAPNFSETYDTRNVGSGKTMTPAGVVTDGNSGANYSYTFTSGPVGSITTESITVTGAAASKVYDGTTASPVAPAITAGALGAGDIAAFSQTYDNQNAGSGKLLTPAGSVNDGNDGANYTVTLTPANVGSITARPVTVTAAPDSKTYDGTTSSAGVPAVTLGNLIGSDAGNFTQTFDTKDAGTNKVLTPAGSVSDGNAGANYSVTLASANTGIISTATVEGGITANDKVYDGTNTASIATWTLTGQLGNNVVQLTGGTATFDDQYVGTNKLVTATNLTLTGADALDYALLSTGATNSASIMPATLSLSIVANNKPYDGTTAATLASATTNGVAGSDDVTLTGDAPSFASQNIGTNIPVTMANLVLGGTTATNYQLTNTTAATTANISALPLTVGGITANSKIYDGTALATLNTGGAVLVGVLPTENVTLDASGASAAFFDKIAALNKAVTISGLALAGPDDGNYTLVQPAATASITAVTVSGGITANDKTYDSTASATVATRAVNGVLGSDAVSLTGGSASFGDKNVGTNKTVTATGLALTGGDAVNYRLASDSATTTASITARTLNVTATGVDKGYDGTTAATVTYSDDRANSDVLTETGTATFADANVGTNKPITVGSIGLSGTDSGNYTPASTTASTSANITSAMLTVTADNYTRGVGAANPVFTATYAGFVNGEDTNVLQGAPLLTTVADTNSLDGTYAITVTNGTLSATNYLFTFVNGTLTVIPANLLFSDNFTRNSDPQPLLPPWTVESGNWTVTGGVLEAGTNAPMTYGAAYIDTNWTDYSVETKVQFSDLGNFGGGVGGRLNAATGAHYAAWIYPANSTAPGAASTLCLIKFQDWQDWGYLNTTNLPIAQVSLTNTDLNWHTLKLAMHGNQLAVYLDGSQLINTNDVEAQPYLTGGITAELWTDANPYVMSFDDVFVAAPVSQTMTFAPLADTTYGTAPFDISAAATASSGLPVTYSIVSGPATISNTVVTITGAGIVTVGASQPGDATYDVAPMVPQSFNVNPAALSVSADSATSVYGATLPTFTGELTGVVNGDAITASFGTLATPASGVGSYAITPALNDPNLALTNYIVTQTNGVLSITPAAMVVTADSAARPYGAANPAFTGSLNGLENGDAITASYSTLATLASGVGPYAITPGLNDPNLALSNYTVTLTPGTLTVTPAALSVAADSLTSVYGGAIPTLTGKLTGVLNGDAITATYSTLATPASAVGPYAITPGLNDLNLALANYTVTSIPGTLTVTPAPLTLTANDSTQVYGAAQPTFTGSVTGVVNGDGITANYATVAQPTSGVGSYAVVPSAVDPNGKIGNYTVSLVDGNLSITPAALTGTVASQSRPYGTTNDVFSVNYSGFVNGDDSGVVSGPVAYACVDSNLVNVDTNTAVGSYPIHVTVGQTAANYSIGYVDGSLTVTPAALLVSAQNQSRAYGMTNPATVATYVGFVNDEDSNVLSGTPEMDAQADTNSVVGTYPIVVSVGTLSNANYALSFSNATLTVTAEALTVTADNLSSVYGAAIPTLTGEVAGLQPQDGITVSYSTTATTASGVGGYAITPSLGDPNNALSNYTVTLTPGTLTVSPAALSVTADSLTAVYGGAIPTLTGELTGVVNGDAITANYSTTATTASTVGQYAITPNLSDPNLALTNYTVTTTAGTLTVTPTALSVTADSLTSVYGGAIPTFTGELTGVVNGDAITAGYSTLATPASAVGPYAITPGLTDPNLALTNYTVTSVPGTLTVSPAALTLTADDATQVYGAAQPSFTGNVAGVVNGDGITASFATVALPTSGVGSYAIVPGAVDPNGKIGNYAVTLVNGTLAITPAPSSITWTNPADIVYGQALGDDQLDAIGSVPGVLTYDPPAGTVLNVSNAQDLSVTLTPSDTNFTPASTTVLINVLQAGTTTVVTSSANPALPGTQVTLTAALTAVAPGSGLPTGTVQFSVDGSPMGAPASLAGGVAQLATSSLSHGAHSVTAAYAGDTNFTGSTNDMAAQQIINTPPTAPPYSVTSLESTSYTFPASELMSRVTDADGDAVNLTQVTATDTNGGVVTLTGQMITYTPAFGVTNTESFTYTVTDTFGGTATGMVTVRVVAPPTGGQKAPVVIMPNGHAAIALTAQPGEDYLLQGSTDLQNWTNLGEVSAGPDGMVRVEDGDAQNYNARYYRLVYTDNN